MAKKNFMAYGDAETIFTEYAGALNRKLNCFSGTKEEFLALSVAERKKYEYVLDPTADVVVYAVMDEVDDVELTFTNDVATVPIPGVTAKSKIWVFYSDASYDVAKAADITVTSGSGIVTFTAANTPTDTITCDILYYLKKDTTNFASVVGGSGYEIIDGTIDSIGANNKKTITLSPTIPTGKKVIGWSMYAADSDLQTYMQYYGDNYILCVKNIGNSTMTNKDYRVVFIYGQ